MIVSPRRAVKPNALAEAEAEAAECVGYRVGSGAWVESWQVQSPADHWLGPGSSWSTKSGCSQ